MNYKIKALMKHLEVKADEIKENNNTYEVGRKEYLVLTDEEADEKTAEYIKDSLWAFNASLISADGRGHFLSTYDGEENEVKIDYEWFYIYRIKQAIAKAEGR